MNMLERISALTGPPAKAFCIQLWFELTLVGRGIWSDNTLDPATQLNALKWLNEIQHRVWNAHANARDDALARLLERISAHCMEAPELKGEVGVALHRALDKAEMALQAPSLSH